MDAKNKQIILFFCSVETHMLGMQRFWETHFMLIVYLIRNSNCLGGLINSWKSNKSIVYPVSCCLYTSMKYSCHDKAVWQLLLCWVMNLFGLKSPDTVTINYSDRERETTSKAHINNCITTQSLYNRRETDGTTSSWARLSALWQIMKS